jgi:predicted transcriptional regulator
MAVISLKLTDALDARLTEQAHRRRLSKSELVRRVSPVLRAG